MDNFLNINYQNEKEENKKLSSSRIESYSTLKGLLSEIYDNLKEKNINVDLKTINLLKKNINIKKTHSVNISRDIKNNNKKKVKKIIYPLKNNQIKLKNNIKIKSKSFKQIANKLHLNSIFNNNTNNNNNKNNIFTLSKSLDNKIKNKHLFLKRKQSKKILEKSNFKLKHFKTTLLKNNIINKLEIKNNSNLISTKKSQIFSKKFELTELQNSLRNNLFNYEPEKNNKIFENNSEDDNAKEKKKDIHSILTIYVNVEN